MQWRSKSIRLPALSSAGANGLFGGRGGCPGFLVQHVVRRPHVHATIGVLGTLVVAVDVQPEATDAGSLASCFANVIVKGLVDSLSAVVGVYVDALDPPEQAVAPIAELGRDHELADDATVHFGDEVAAERGVVEDAAYAAGDRVDGKFEFLGLAGNGAVVGRDGVGVGGRCGAYVNLGHGDIVRGKRLAHEGGKTGTGGRAMALSSLVQRGGRRPHLSTFPRSCVTMLGMITDFSSRRVTVMGLGRFGGGVGVARWLARQGAAVTVTDQADEQTLAPSLTQLADLDITLHLGRHEVADFRDVDLVVVNPAVPEASEFLQVARDADVPITTEINLFVERCPARTVGITGSVGKSTITAMIGHILNAAANAGAHGAPHRAWVGGNIGRSLLDDLPEMTADDVVVLELSSFQLERTPRVEWSPHIAVLTSITPNHIDWHGSFAAYSAAKLNLLRYQRRAHDVIVIQDTPELCTAVRAACGDLDGAWRYGLEDTTPVAVSSRNSGAELVLRWAGLQLDVPGLHNRQNAAAALAATHALGVAEDVARTALGTFEALPHRLQKVAERDGVTYYDDSKSTTPEAAMTALRAFDQPVCIILGGYDKQSDLTPIAREAAEHARFAACIGTTGPRLVDAICAAGGTAAGFAGLDDAVAACRGRAQPGDVILLSPACASWDQFVDYRERGEAFAALARGATTP